MIPMPTFPTITSNDCYTIIGVVSGILTILTFLLTYFRGDKIHFLKRANYYLRNKKITVKLNSIRTYSYFQENTNTLAGKIRENYDKNVDYLATRQNNIEVLIKNSQAPYLIEFSPNIAGFEENVKEIKIQIRLLGNITFRFREDEENRSNIKNIERLYTIIENTYGITPNFQDYNLTSTMSDFEDDWKRVSTEEVDNGMVYIGRKVLDIHLPLLGSLYDIYKKKITSI
jgi:hypothetical protein